VISLCLFVAASSARAGAATAAAAAAIVIFVFVLRVANCVNRNRWILQQSKMTKYRVRLYPSTMDITTIENDQVPCSIVSVDNGYYNNLKWPNRARLCPWTMDAESTVCIVSYRQWLLCLTEQILRHLHEFIITIYVNLLSICYVSINDLIC
jgi:hypothetical protein